MEVWLEQAQDSCWAWYLPPPHTHTMQAPLLHMGMHGLADWVMVKRGQANTFTAIAANTSVLQIRYLAPLQTC